MTKVSTELARLEEMLMRLHRVLSQELVNINRRMDQHDEALLEVARSMKAAPGQREAIASQQEKESSAKP